jgi:hypothetical protein
MADNTDPSEAFMRALEIIHSTAQNIIKAHLAHLGKVDAC